MKHDVFICHASEDKDGLVRPLAEALRARHLDVWYDEFSLSVGDSLREAIDKGLNSARFGVVVISPAFFAKSWTKRELSGLVAREMIEGQQVILPVWHNVQPTEVLKFSAPLADVVALNSIRGVGQLCDDLVQKIRPEVSPLLVAHDELERFGWDLPPLTDEWWLDQVELQEQFLMPNQLRPLMFKLPYPYGSDGRERGLNIAWTTLQLDWQSEAEDIRLCQMTPPEEALDFVRSNTALFEACQRDPATLANYLPQLLIPAFSAEFGPAFDELLKRSEAQTKAQPDSRFPDALCSRRLALRHPTFGGHSAYEVTDKWMRGQGMSYGSDLYPTMDYLFWLLSASADWMLEAPRRKLIDGMKACHYWPDDLMRREGRSAKLTDEALRERGGATRWTAKLRKELEGHVERSAQTHELADVPTIVQRFIDEDFLGEQRRLRASWRRR
jgi:hypothetical protein